MKKDTIFEWNQQYHEALECIKTYLSAPHVLASPIKGKPLVLYITTLDHSICVLLPQKDAKGKEILVLPQSNTR